MRQLRFAAIALLVLAPRVRADDLRATALVRQGLENVTVDSTQVAFENRRWRHPLDGLAAVTRTIGEPPRAVIRRQGLDAAGITILRGDTLGGHPRAKVRVAYPCDPGWTPSPSRRLAPTWRTVDVTLGPVFDYELGRVFEPFLFRLDGQAVLRWNPWPGALARAGIVFPGQNLFDFDPEHPDRDIIHPEPLAFDQFLWLPSVALLSASGGYFGDNRWGTSLGAARPLAGGLLLLDTQLDWTGFMAFSEGGLYSSPSHFSGFAALTWHAGDDVSLRVKAAQFLRGDRGTEVALSRSIGDADLGLFAQKAGGERLLGMRLDLPVPPLTRPTHWAVRVLPIERLHFDYKSRSQGEGRSLGGAPSREDFLRQLDAPSLAARLGRYDPALAGPGPPSETWVTMASFTGTTGFINTPWAGVMPDRGIEAGYAHIPARWAYDQRQAHDNEEWYATLGLLPRVEISGRITVFPGLATFSDVVPDTRLTDTDYMASTRVLLVRPRPGRPGLAAGVDDVQGTRRFHASYVVAGVPYVIQGMQTRLSLGYAFRAFKATRHTLDGAFGAAEISPWHVAALQIEHDGEKWNVALAVPTRFGIRLRAALLHLQTPSFGGGLFVPLK